MSTKKATKAQAAEATYSVKDIVLAKVKGYPPWPAMVVDPDNVAKHVKKERPISKKTTFYCVRFFPAGDYSWAVAKDLSRLQTHEIEAYINEPSKKNTELKRGYEVALNPTPWIDEIERKEADAEAAAAEEEEGVDQLEDSESGGEEEMDSDADSASAKKKKSQSKKRKRDSAAAEDGKKKRKNAQEALSAKRRPVAGSKKAGKGKSSSTDKAESEDGVGAMAELEAGEEESARKKARTSRNKADEGDEKPGKRSKKDKDDDDENNPLNNDPEALRVKDWRHKLQRGFLTKPPHEEDMPQMDQIFLTVESYPNLTIEYLQFSKIGKVMRRIASLQSIPRDEDFHFKDRSLKLVAKWQAILQDADQTIKNGDVNGKPAEASTAAEATSADADADAAPAPATVKPESKPAVNGVHTEDADAPMVNGDTSEKKETKEDTAMDTSDS